MRTIISNEMVDHPIRLGEIIKWAPDWFTEPIMIIAEYSNDECLCDGCACKDHSCNVFMDYRNKTQSMSICCIKPSWMTNNDGGVSRDPRFCILKKLDTVMEGL